MIGKANCLYMNRNYDEAIKIYEQVALIDCDEYTSFQGLGNCYLKIDQLKIALDYYEKVISLKPEYCGGYLGKGNALYLLNDYENALIAYDFATKFN